MRTRPRGGRVWEGIRVGFVFLFLAGQAEIQNTIQYCASVILLYIVLDLKGYTLGIRLGHFR